MKPKGMEDYDNVVDGEDKVKCDTCGNDEFKVTTYEDAEDKTENLDLYCTKCKKLDYGVILGYSE